MIKLIGQGKIRRKRAWNREAADGHIHRLRCCLRVTAGQVLDTPDGPDNNHKRSRGKQGSNSQFLRTCSMLHKTILSPESSVRGIHALCFSASWILSAWTSASSPNWIVSHLCRRTLKA